MYALQNIIERKKAMSTTLSSYYGERYKIILL